jgi:SAM-dependent methyltransferase
MNDNRVPRSAKGLREWRQRIGNFNQHNRRLWVESIARDLPSRSRVLDVGAGSGQYRDLFSHCEYRSHDFAQEPSTVGMYTTLDYISDITAIPVPNASFDVVLCTEVLEHVPEPIQAVNEMGRILRSGGRLYVSAPLGSWLHQEPYHYYGGYTPHWYRRFLDAAGFDVQSIEPNQRFFSAFGQEALRFAEIVDPRRAQSDRIAARLILGMLWLGAFPLSRLAAMLAPSLDSLELEQIATIGYHVTAIKR